MIKAVMMIKESSATEVIDELKDVISKEPVLIKIVPDTDFNLRFGKTTKEKLELPQEVVHKAMELAHKNDITLNEQINRTLNSYIEEKGGFKAIEEKDGVDPYSGFKKYKTLKPKAETSFDLNEAVDDLITRSRDISKQIDFIKDDELKKLARKSMEGTAEEREVAIKELNKAVDDLIN